MLPHIVISLRQSVERRNALRKEFEKINKKPIFFDAVDGRSKTEDELRLLTHAPLVMKKGEVGCALSHLQVYKRMIEEDLPLLWVFEDDVIIKKTFAAILPYLERFAHEYMKGRPAVLLPWTMQRVTHKVADLSTEISVYHSIYGIYAHAYLITKEAAANILKIQTPLRWQIDAWKFYYLLDALRIYGLNQHLVQRPDDTESIINKMDMRNNKKRQSFERRKKMAAYIYHSPRRAEILFHYLHYMFMRPFAGHAGKVHTNNE